MLPSDVVGETAEHAEAASRTKVSHAKGVRNDHALHASVLGRDTLESLEAGECLISALDLAGKHAADHAPDDLGRSPVVDRTTLRVRERALAKESSELDLVADQRSRNVHVLTPNNDNLLALQKLLGNEGGKTAKEMATSVDNDSLFEHHCSVYMPQRR